MTGGGVPSGPGESVFLHIIFRIGAPAAMQVAKPGAGSAHDME